MTKLLKKSISFLFCFYFTAGLFAANVLSDDIEIKNSVKNLNLGNHTATVTESGVVLEKCNNGKIVVSASVGPGLVTLKNCSNVSVELNSSACLLLDNKTQIDTLYIKGNALVNSLEVFQAESANKNYVQKKAAHVNRVLIESGLSAVLKNFDYDIKQEIQSSSDKNSAEKEPELQITLDKSYKGPGVRFVIQNIPEEAQTLQVKLIDNTGTKYDISWISTGLHAREFYSGYYEYEFLNAGEEYEFEFIYSAARKTIVKYYIKAVPEKGINVLLEKENVSLKIDEETGEVSWESVPKTNLPDGTKLVYDFDSIDSKYNWHFAGSREADSKDFSSFNMYDDVTWYFPGNIINDTVFIHVYYRYQNFRWSIINETRSFKIKDID